MILVLLKLYGQLDDDQALKLCERIEIFSLINMSEISTEEIRGWSGRVVMLDSASDLIDELTASYVEKLNLI